MMAVDPGHARLGKIRDVGMGRRGRAQGLHQALMLATESESAARIGEHDWPDALFRKHDEAAG